MPTGIELAKEKKLEGKALAMKVNGELKDLTANVDKGADVKLLTFDDPEGKAVFWHTTAHIFAHAIKNLYPDALNTIGPSIEHGFYYDFDNLTITPEDFRNIEKEMRKIAERKLVCERKEITLDDVKKLFPNNPYKAELAKEFAGEGKTLTAYTMGPDFIDLCKGPHTPHTGYVKAMKLQNITSAYWRGDQKNKALTRIYGTAFPSDNELKEFLKQQEEAEKRDHRKIGAQLGLFMFSEKVGMGLPLWLPKGETIRHELIEYIRKKEEEYGYQFVWTPHITLSALYHASGHLPHYQEFMYPLMKEDEHHEYALKPMNCPHHHQIYQRLVTSYRDLPLLLAEEGTVYRKELSGVSSGMLRVRGMTTNDAHIYVTPAQLEEEFIKVLQLFKEVYGVLGIHDYYFRLSLPDFEKNPDKFIGDKKLWDGAAQSIRSAMQKFGAKFEEAAGEAAFYGPKIDVQIKNIYGREETIATSQVDIIVPQRMGLTYTDEQDKRQHPIVIHRAIYGSYERFFAHLIEHYAGKFPLWLSPVQVKIVPVAERFVDYARSIGATYFKEGVRVEVDEGTETLNKKIRRAELERINYILVVGAKEQENKSVNIRTRDNVVEGEKKPDEFLKRLKQEILDKK